MADAAQVRRACTEPECIAFNYSNGLCRSHYYKKRRAEAAAQRPQRVAPSCKRDGCEQPGTAGYGWCGTHYYAHYRHPELTLTAEDVRRVYPSTTWGVREWQAALTVRGDIVERILDDMFRMAFS
jgi:hypothetical protein